MKLKIISSALLVLAFFLFSACEKDEEEDNVTPVATCSDGIQNGDETGIDCGGPDCQPCIIPGAPEVTTDGVIVISPNEVRIIGTVTRNGDSPVTERGFVYDVSENPLYGNNSVSSDMGPSEFDATISNLMPDVTYYVRAYAINSQGISYGNELNFSTTGGVAGPVVVSGWIDPADGKIYAANSEGEIKSKNRYTDSWRSVDGATFSGENLRSVWIDPADGRIYGADAKGEIRRKTTYTSSWSYVDDATFSNEDLRSVWIDPADGRIYGADAKGEIRRKATYTSSWSYVDDATFNGEGLRSVWIEPADGRIYGAGVNGEIRRKSTYTDSWRFENDASFSDGELASVWIDPADGKIYGLDSEGKFRSKNNYSDSWRFIDDSKF